MLSYQINDPRQFDPKKTHGVFYRYPSHFRRCCFVGITLAMPGTIAGMLMLLLPGSWAPGSALFAALAGTTLGFLAGVLMEKD